MKLELINDKVGFKELSLKWDKPIEEVVKILNSLRDCGFVVIRDPLNNCYVPSCNGEVVFIRSKEKADEKSKKGKEAGHTYSLSCTACKLRTQEFKTEDECRSFWNSQPRRL